MHKRTYISICILKLKYAFLKINKTPLLPLFLDHYEICLITKIYISGGAFNLKKGKFKNKTDLVQDDFL